jgi:hypothetical protein
MDDAVTVVLEMGHLGQHKVNISPSDYLDRFWMKAENLCGKPCPDLTFKRQSADKKEFPYHGKRENSWAKLASALPGLTANEVWSCAPGSVSSTVPKCCKCEEVPILYIPEA